jgi:6,7-dimethyl-8-ribityllumazine synthase
MFCRWQAFSLWLRRRAFAVAGYPCAPMPSTGSGADMNQKSVRRQSPRIAFIQSCWHRDIVDRARVAFLKALEQRGYARRQVECFEVPGAFEIPLHAKLLAKSGRYAAVVAAGFVVDGGIYRHEFVASSVIDALMRVQLDTEVPVISVVLTPQRFHEHEEHRKFFSEHFVTKGEEAAQACIGAISGIEKLRSLVA